MNKERLALALVCVLALSALAAGETVDSLLTQAKMQYQAEKYQQTIDLLLRAISLINKQIPLKIANLCLCKKVEGFREYDRRPDFALSHGEPFLLYFEIEGYNTVKDGENYLVSLAQDAKVTDQDGDVLFNEENWIVLNNAYQTPVVPVYFTNRLTGMDKGTFTVTITVRDVFKKKSIQKTFDFTVH